MRLERAVLRVVDAKMSNNLAELINETGASLVVNAGFFDATGQPEGFVVSDGVALSAWSESLGGGVLEVWQHRGRLVPAEGFVAHPGASFAIQARPRLVVDGASNLVGDDGRPAERTALCLRDGGRTLDIVVARGDAPGSGPSLALFADMLASRGCEGALNLDGGPSTGVSWREAVAEDLQVRDLAPRGPVRQAIAVWLPPQDG